MEKLARGAKKKFVARLLNEGKHLTQENLRFYAMQEGDKRLYTTRLGSCIFNLREEGYPILTVRRKNKGSNGSHAVYYLSAVNNVQTTARVYVTRTQAVKETISKIKSFFKKGK